MVSAYLSDKKLQAMRNKYEKTAAWLVDEVSMISSNILWIINSRLNSIAGITDPGILFGGMIVIFFGSASLFSLGSPQTLNLNPLFR